MGDLSKNFNVSEFACKCGCGLKEPSPALVSLLQNIRDRTGQPVIIESGWRCTQHNKDVGSKILGKQGIAKGQRGDETASAHTRGEAADIRIKGMTKKDLYEILVYLYKCGQIDELEYAYMIKKSKTNVHVGVDKKKRNNRFGGEQ
ncbi:MAG: hypothetical protein LBP21_05290 [Synergistaceae bacterium]|jgi:hypothetical protein|nr:hypothetical protein [Synergistaceae bacterium]